MNKIIFSTIGSLQQIENQWEISSSFFLNANGQWHSKYVIGQNTFYITTLPEWTLLKIDFTEAKYGINLIYDKINTILDDICFIKFRITYPVFQMGEIFSFEDLF